MEEDRMLSDEILLGIINAKSGGGGGGGTDDYNDLKNQPKIEGVTLKGNKTAADLGLATAAALADKVDKVQGKGLSTNDFTDAYKTAIGDNTTALALKQNATDNNLDTEDKTIVGAINENAGDIGQLKSGLTTLDTEVNGDATVYPYADVITIEDAVPANLADCSVKIEPVQSGSGDPSPTNIRPITGHTEASVQVTDGDETTKTYTIALGDTVYGGTVDFDSGVMTVTHKYVDLGDFTYQTSSVFKQAHISDVKRPASNNVPIDAICEQYRFVARYSAENDGDACVDTDGYLKVRTTDTPDGGFCYELATPTTIQLTPQQIQLLKGQNTLTASTGQISVTVNGVSGAIGSLTSDKQDKTDYALETTEKTVVGAINELLERPSYVWGIEQPQSVSDLVGKFMVVGKICFFQLSATKTNTSYNLGVIRGISCLVEGVVAYDNVNDVPVYIINDPNTTAVAFQIKSGATYTNPTVISGLFFLA